MKILGTLLKFLWKLLLITTYMISKGAELVLQAINNTFKAFLEK